MGDAEVACSKHVPPPEYHVQAARYAGLPAALNECFWEISKCLISAVTTSRAQPRSCAYVPACGNGFQALTLTSTGRHRAVRHTEPHCAMRPQGV